jgi:hypothetical protein
MILEGIVTTLSPLGEVNIAPMGPEVGPTLDRFVLKPYRTAQTYRNLRAHGEGVLHVSDDVLLLARAALGVVEPRPVLVPASAVRGVVLEDCCRFYEFRVTALDDRLERTRIDVEVIHSGWRRDFFGLNRAKHAVVEAAILATRTAFLPREEIEAEYRKLAVLVQKTGGPQEQAAFELLSAYLAKLANSGGQPA